MVWKNINARPSVIKDETEVGAENFYSDSNRIRFVRGKPRKLGGWEKQVTAQPTGLVRGMLDWVDYNNARWLVLGSECKLEVLQESTIFNITPERTTSPSSGTLSNPFSTTSGSFTVKFSSTTIAGATVRSAPWIRMETVLPARPISLLPWKAQ